MEKEFLPPDRALKLKEFGFDEPCISYYTAFGKFSNDYSAPRKYNSEFELGSYISAPTFSQVFDWLLDKHSLYAVVIPTVTMHWTFKTMTVFQGMVEVPPYEHVDAHDYSTKKEAELAALDALLEILDLKKKQ